MLELPLRLRTLLSACPRGAPVICASADRCVVIVISLDYIAAGKNLRLRFRRATTEQAGKDEFRFDITKIVSDMHVIFAAGWEDYEHISTASGGFSPVKYLDAVPSSPSCLPVSASSALRTTRSMKHKMQNAA